MGMKPLHDRIIVKRMEQEQKTASGLYIPDSAQEKPQFGEIVSAGPETKTLKGGDTILFAKYAGTEFKVDGDELLIMREDDVLAVVEK